MLMTLKIMHTPRYESGLQRTEGSFVTPLLICISIGTERVNLFTLLQTKLCTHRVNFNGCFPGSLLNDLDCCSGEWTNWLDIAIQYCAGNVYDSLVRNVLTHKRPLQCAFNFKELGCQFAYPYFWILMRIGVNVKLTYCSGRSNGMSGLFST